MAVRLTESQYRSLLAGQQNTAKEPKRFRLTPPKVKLAERDVTKQVLDFLRIRGWSVHRCHVGVYQPISGGSPVRMGEPGMSDFWAVREKRPRYGRGVEFFWLELKAPGKKPSPEQLEWMRRQHALGLEAVWFDSIDKLAEWVKERFN